MNFLQTFPGAVMPIDKRTQIGLSTVVSIEQGKAFKRLAKKHFRSVSAELAQLINKALEEDKNHPSKS